MAKCGKEWPQLLVAYISYLSIEHMKPLHYLYFVVFFWFFGFGARHRLMHIAAYMVCEAKGSKSFWIMSVFLSHHMLAFAGSETTFHREQKLVFASTKFGYFVLPFKP